MPRSTTGFHLPCLPSFRNAEMAAGHTNSSIAKLPMDGAPKRRHVRWQWTVAIGRRHAVDHLRRFRHHGAYHDGPAVDFISYWARSPADPRRTCGTILRLCNSSCDGSNGQANRPSRASFSPLSSTVSFLRCAIRPAKVLVRLWSMAGDNGCRVHRRFRRVAPLPYSLAHPSVLTNMLIGQNGFLTSAIFVTGANLLDKRPFLAGGHPSACWSSSPS